MRWLVVLALAGCGRVGFDVLADAVAADVMLATCMPGQPLVPVAVLNESQSAPQDACNINNVLALDGTPAGLDRSAGSLCVSWDPEGSCGCVALDLGAVYAIDRIEVHLRPVGQACGTPCQSATCGTGHGFTVSVGIERGAYTPLPDVLFGASTTFQARLLEDDVDVRYVVGCRVSYGEERDDIEVDLLAAYCR